jgi:hypothetical protein
MRDTVVAVTDQQLPVLSQLARNIDLQSLTSARMALWHCAFSRTFRLLQNLASGEARRALHALS